MYQCLALLLIGIQFGVNDETKTAVEKDLAAMQGRPAGFRGVGRAPAAL